eukprot:5630290-Pyramimonas_sp.AAC.1
MNRRCAPPQQRSLRPIQMISKRHGHPFRQREPPWQASTHFLAVPQPPHFTPHRARPPLLPPMAGPVSPSDPQN